jgi:hypothetical protein
MRASPELDGVTCAGGWTEDGAQAGRSGFQGSRGVVMATCSANGVQWSRHKYKGSDVCKRCGQVQAKVMSVHANRRRERKAALAAIKQTGLAKAGVAQV